MGPEDNLADDWQPTEEEWKEFEETINLGRSLAVEKTGEIKEGVTPPEGKESPKEKTAAADTNLQQHPTQRMADAAEDKRIQRDC